MPIPRRKTAVSFKLPHLRKRSAPGDIANDNSCGFTAGKSHNSSQGPTRVLMEILVTDNGKIRHVAGRSEPVQVESSRLLDPIARVTDEIRDRPRAGGL